MTERSRQGIGRPRRLRTAAAALALLGLASSMAAGSTDLPDTLRLSLDDVLTQLAEVSPRIHRYEQLAAAADGGRREARSARFPQIDLAAGYARSSDVPEFAVSLPGIGRQVIAPNLPDAWRTRASLSWPIFTGGRVSGLAAAATDEQVAACSDLAGAEVDLRYEATAAYWSLVLARARVRVLSEGMGAFDRHLVDAENRWEVGLAARSDLLAVTVERDRSELALLQARNGVVVAEENLRRLLDLPAVAVSPCDSLAVPPMNDGTEEPVAPVVDALLETARAERPDRQAAAARVRAAQARVTAMRGARWPQLLAVAGYDYSRPNRRYTPAADQWDESWDASVQLSLSVFDGGKTTGAVARTSAQLRALQEQERELDLALRFEVTARVHDRRTAQRACAVAARAVESAREHARVVADRFDEGVCSSSDLLDAEVLALRAGLEELDARVQWSLARAALDRAVGGGR